MSKKNTQNKTHLDLTKNSFNDLFNSNSSDSLINHKELNLINSKELSLVKTDDLKLVNLGALLFFVRYVGALSLTLILSFALGATLFSAQRTITDSKLNTRKLDNSNPRGSYQYDLSYTTQKNSDGRKSLHTYNLVTPVYTDERPLGSSLPKSEATLASNRGNVLGTQAKAATVELDACSFTVDGSAYSNESKLSVETNSEVEVCVRYSSIPGFSVWELGYSSASSETLTTNDGCLYVDSPQTGETLAVELQTPNNTAVAACSLVFDAQ